MAGVILVVAATVMDGDVSRRFVNIESTATGIDDRSTASTAIGLPAAVSANRSLKTLLRPTPRSASSSSSSSNSRPAERDGLCCWVLCRRRFWRLETVGPPRDDDDGSYDPVSAVLCGRSPSQSSAGAVFRAVPVAGRRGSFLLAKQTYKHKTPVDRAVFTYGQKCPKGGRPPQQILISRKKPNKTNVIQLF